MGVTQDNKYERLGKSIREQRLAQGLSQRKLAGMIGQPNSHTYITRVEQGKIKIVLKYGEGKTPVIKGLRRVSKPGLRIYSGAEELPKVMKGLGIAIVSTSKGVMTDREARRQNIGGEVLAFIW